MKIDSKESNKNHEENSEIKNKTKTLCLQESWSTSILGSE